MTFRRVRTALLPPVDARWVSEASRVSHPPARGGETVRHIREPVFTLWRGAVSNEWSFRAALTFRAVCAGCLNPDNRKAPMRVFLDACVLFPTVLREMLIGLEALYQPLWSQKVLDEWRYSVAARLGPEAGRIAQAEIALLTARFPAAMQPQGDAGARLAALEAVGLPDEDDRHVIEAALRGGADLIVTENRRDFPRRRLEDLGLRVLSPDEFIAALMQDDRAAVLAVARAVHARAVAAGGDIGLRALFKRARLPRLARALDE